MLSVFSDDRDLAAIVNHIHAKTPRIPATAAKTVSCNTISFHSEISRNHEYIMKPVIHEIHIIIPNSLLCMAIFVFQILSSYYIYFTCLFFTILYNFYSKKVHAQQ